IGGQSMAGLSPEKRDVAMVFPRGALYPHLTVYENLAWGARLREPGSGWSGWSWCEPWWRWLKLPWSAERAQRRTARDQRVRSVADQLGLGALLDRLPSQLSDGQRQR